MTTSPSRVSGEPSWPHCAQGADPATDPVGCRGIHVPGHTACLAHLSDVDRAAYLAGLTPGADIDHRATPFAEPLLDALLDALRDPATGHSLLGKAEFREATFEGAARFREATFQGEANFGYATFQSRAWFMKATFRKSVWFMAASFQDRAWFEKTTFQGRAWFTETTFQSFADFTGTTFQRRGSFGGATFQGAALFGGATFQKAAEFGEATFQEHTGFLRATFQDAAIFGRATFQKAAGFDEATFQYNAYFSEAIFQRGTRFAGAAFQRHVGFEQAVFEQRVNLGPFECAGEVTLSGAVFNGPATLLFAARRLECQRTRWLSTAEMRLRYATVDFSHAVFEYPLTIAAEISLFVLPDGRTMAEQALSHTHDATVRIATLRGVDAAHLVLTDVDLSGRLLTGTVHLDQLRLEGIYSFDEVPPRHRWRPARFTQRRVLAEEHHWRAKQLDAVRGWNVAVLDAEYVGPAQLAPVYRALRKSFEDSKNEPGAADFYYGEMEMRRHDRVGTPRAERFLLHAYWLLSGYGLRALRALGWLAATMLVTIVLLVGFGLPKEDSKQEATGTVPAGGGKVTFEIEKNAPPESHRGQVDRKAPGEGPERHAQLGSVPLQWPGSDHRRHLH
ncbi:pentapeptide repeat-containing protein [Streptomyces anthocyanicus]|uniref:pentapeptide repeat-containing protein n=1 Tax=Streptomyces anthocyanicus TaxID=68174 RepID=UPI0038001A52